MIVDKVYINEEFFKGKTFEEFNEALKGKLRSDKIKEAYDKLPKLPKPKVEVEVKEESKPKKYKAKVKKEEEEDK